MSLVNLNISPRTTSGKNANRRSRAAGRLPAVLYGKGRATNTIELDSHDFGLAMVKLAGRSAIFQLHQPGMEEGHIALLREVQRNPVTDQILHVDLLEIPRGQPVVVMVNVNVSGLCQAVKMGEGSVALAITSVEVSCLPRNLPEFVEVDISDLELNDKIFVRDLKVEGGEIVSDPDTLVLNIKPALLLVDEPEKTEGGEGEDGDGDGEDDKDKDKGKDKGKGK